jgi:hypothetical protein
LTCHPFWCEKCDVVGNVAVVDVVDIVDQENHREDQQELKKNSYKKEGYRN